MKGKTHASHDSTQQDLGMMIHPPEVAGGDAVTPKLGL